MRDKPMKETLSRLNLYIAGEWRGSHGRDVQAVINPATGGVIGELPHANAADLDAALDASSTAFRQWRDESPTRRGAILRRAALLMRERQETAAGLMTREQGKPLTEARLELAAAADILDWTANEGLRAYGRVIPSRQSGTRQMTLKEPVGVVAAFSPWNFPAATPMRKIAAALAAGCTCIIKPSEETPETALEIARALHDAGLGRRTQCSLWHTGSNIEADRHRRNRSQDLLHGLTGCGQAAPHSCVARSEAHDPRARWTRALHSVRQRRCRTNCRASSGKQVPERRPDLHGAVAFSHSGNGVSKVCREFRFRGEPHPRGAGRL